MKFGVAVRPTQSTGGDYSRGFLCRLDPKPIRERDQSGLPRLGHLEGTLTPSNSLAPGSQNSLEIAVVSRKSLAFTAPAHTANDRNIVSFL
jgi:hypothetical protein